MIFLLTIDANMFVFARRNFATIVVIERVTNFVTNCQTIRFFVFECAWNNERLRIDDFFEFDDENIFEQSFDDIVFNSSNE